MAILVQFNQSGVTAQQYDSIRKEIGWEADPPRGAMFHAAGFIDGELRSTDVWASQADLESYFRDRFAPVAAKHGLNPPMPQGVPIHLMATVPGLLAANSLALRAAEPA